MTTPSNTDQAGGQSAPAADAKSPDAEAGADPVETLRFIGGFGPSPEQVQAMRAAARRSQGLTTEQRTELVVEALRRIAEVGRRTGDEAAAPAGNPPTNAGHRAGRSRWRRGRCRKRTGQGQRRRTIVQELAGGIECHMFHASR